MMAAKPKKSTAPKAETFPRKAVPVFAGKTEEETCRNHAVVTTSPELAAYRVINAVEGKSVMGEHIDVPTMLDELRSHAAAVNRGNLAQAEAMLMNQATALQSVFARLTEKAMGTEYMSQFETYMRLGLKAQAQSRATLESLSAIKNPPVVYARQANVTTGPQQINNGMAVSSRAREIESEQTQLSGGTHELLPDTRTSGNASRVNSALETLGEIDRAEVPRG